MTPFVDWEGQAVREGLVLCCRPVAASVDTAVAGALAVAGTPVACTADNVALEAVESTLLAKCTNLKKKLV